MFRLTGGHQEKHVAKTTQISKSCVPSHLFWIRSTGILFELTHWSSIMPQLLGSLWTIKGREMASLRCADNAEYLCETPFTLLQDKW